MNGIGMPRDAHAAAICFLRAAVQGYATAQYNIARSYETGEGVNRDAEKARYWYGKAARQGDADAQTRLEAF
jgi:TPR repeat protein